jgi:plastocyanin
MRYRLFIVAAALVAAPLVPLAQNGDLTHQQQATADAKVDFGVLVTAPIPGTGCAQTGFGGPNDPCSYQLHHLTPEEVTIEKGGQVTFQIHGGGHAMAILEVSKNTTRDDIGQFLCPGTDPNTIADPTQHTCNLSATNANGAHMIADGKGDVVIVASANPNPPGVHPDNRVWSEPGRLMSAGGVQFLNGGTTDATGTSNTGGQLITYRFLKTGRYLVHCMNRTHFLNDWMFGFVNVTGE